MLQANVWFKMSLVGRATMASDAFPALLENSTYLMKDVKDLGHPL
jgi:hypothetical protein